jgi:hypothetical protein
MADVQHFILAVAAAQGVDAGQQHQANQWLQDFQQADQAWAVALQVLSQDVSAEVLFFTANMLYVKSKSSWKQLGSEVRSAILTAVRFVSPRRLHTHRQVNMCAH